ncbi:MAG: LPS export ABC transporter permease LptG [Parasphingopyxis sp.]|uniref:LPS export ABC transporter permease LptG n=1 Tax=Parasphingopyxis sp. TaxID=1920299 RepID=UPI00262ABA8E|nr:LPS export ABC transporter permease LptG [uncultured Parasphingopyxis sp.]
MAAVSLQFFPSRTIAWYMARVFVTRVFAVLAGLVVILMALDLLGESGAILAQPGNGEAELWLYVSLRVPQLIERFLPFSALLGSLIALSTLNANSEVISMKAAGASAHQILAPLILSSLVIAGLLFVFNERVTAPAYATLSAWEAVEYGPIPDSSSSTNVWVRDGDDLINAASASGRRDGTVLRDVTIYDRRDGTLHTIVHGDIARRDGEAWRLENATRFEVDGVEREELGTITVAEGVTPDQFTLSNVEARALNFPQLQEAIADLQAAGRPTVGLEAGLWHKISGPLSTILMPLLGAIAGFGLARSGQLFIRAIIGMALGFTYFVADNFALAMGNIGAYPPMLAAWAPFFLFLLIGEAVLIRTEE